MSAGGQDPGQGDDPGAGTGAGDWPGAVGSPSAYRGELVRHLPAIFHSWPALARLLDAFESVLFGPQPDGSPGLEQRVASLPDLFGVALDRDAPGHDALSREAPGHDAPGAAGPDEPGRQAPGVAALDPSEREVLLQWLADWVGFTPRALFPPEELRRIVADIVPLYGMRGTRGFVEQLLRLAWPGIERVEIDEQVQGLTVGRSRLGEDSVLLPERPFWFRVTLRMPLPDGPPGERAFARAALEARARALVDFAKPAHTACELVLEEPGTPRPASAPPTPPPRAPSSLAPSPPPDREGEPADE